MAHCWEVVGWYTNDKFTEAQPEVTVGKWFSWGTIGKADISDRWPTVTPQLANVGPTIVCYMGINVSGSHYYLRISLETVLKNNNNSILSFW